MSRWWSLFRILGLGAQLEYRLYAASLTSNAEPITILFRVVHSANDLVDHTGYVGIQTRLRANRREKLILVQIVAGLQRGDIALAHGPGIL
jgi:hypothetical protein